MQTRLSYQINGAILTTFIIITAFFVSLQLPFHEKALIQYKNQIQTILETLVKRDREPLANEIFEGRLRAIRLRLQQMRKVKGILAIDVYNYAGQTLMSDGPKDHFPVSLDLKQIQKDRANKLNEINWHGEAVLSYTHELHIIGERIGFVRILYSLAEARERQQRIWYLFAGLLGCIMLVMLLSLNLILHKAIIKPIKQLGGAMQNLHYGGPKQEVPIETHNEIGQLSQSFNQMALTLDESYHRMQSQDDQLQHAKTYLDNVINSMPSVLIGVDQQGRITHWNRQAVQVTGKTAGQVMDQPVQSIFPDMPEEIALLHQALSQGNIEKKTKMPFTIGKRTLYSDLTIFPLKEGGMEGAVIRADDVTERVRMDEMMIQTEKMISVGGLAAGMAHDFNNILAGILGYAELATLDLPSDSPVRRNLDQILHSCRRAKGLVQQILTFSRPGVPGQSVIFFQKVVREVIDLMRAALPSTIEIRSNLNAAEEVIAGDPTQIHQIVMNLCTNAHDAMREKGGILSITLDTMEIKETQPLAVGDALLQGKYFVLTVKDTGDGMSPEVLDRAFDPYYTTKATGKGTGLGLPMVHGIVKSYEGTVTVDSEPGHGSRFCVYLPMAEGDEASETSLMEDLPLGSERILVVDDEPTIVAIGEDMLSRLGYDVHGFTDPEKALAYIKSDPLSIDLVITDLTMPGLTGDELTKHLLKLRPDLPIIMCTGYGDKITPANAEEMGLKGFILKPVNSSELATTIRQVLDTL